ESLFNDGVAVVLFNLALAAGIAINSGEGVVFAFEEALLEFVRVGFGGLAVGFLLGYVVSYIVLKNVDDNLIETATSVALAFGAFVIAEELHLSGILSVVAAGLMVGNIGMENTSPTTKVTLLNFWEFMAFVVNSLVFLVIGLEIEITQLLPNTVPILVAVAAVLVSRAFVVYGLTWVNNRLEPRRAISRPFQHVMLWGGMRGAISLALALTLTGGVFGTAVAEELRVMTFGVVLFTLLVQGTTIEKLIDWLHMGKKPAQIIEQQRQQAQLYAKWAGRQELERLQKEGILFRDIGEAMDAVYDEEIKYLKRKLREHLQDYPELEQEMLLQARADVLRAERSALGDANRRGFISEELYQEMIREADRRRAALDLINAQRSVELTATLEDKVKQ
ncbi:MAG: cation:proton antiporter, partial [Anaerolineae bacterium]